MFKDLRKFGGEIRRALANFRYEHTDDGQILLIDQKIKVGGMFYHDVNGQDLRLEPNIVVDEGILDLLDVYFHQAVQTLTWYIAPFAGNVTPVNSWTAANFTALSTEFINYDEAARQAFVEAAPVANAISNLANKAAFTVGVGGGTVYGAGVLSASAKSAVTGKLFASKRFAAQRVLSAADVLNIGYTVSATST